MFNHRKTFSKELFDRHDQYAKDVVLSLMKALKYELTDDTEAYGSHDFIVAKDGKEYKVEVEQKMGWKYDEFPFPTHDVSYRKRTSKADYFFQVNARGTALMMCPMSMVISSPVVRKNTKLGTMNEPFFAVPTDNVRYFYLEDGKWFEDEIISDTSSS